MNSCRQWFSWLALLAACSTAMAEPPLDTVLLVDEAIERLENWIKPRGTKLGDPASDNLVRWQKFLRTVETVAADGTKLPSLTDELEKGRLADPQVFREILEIYRRPVKGLQLSRFVAVRKALEAHLARFPHRDPLADRVSKMPVKVRPIPGDLREKAWGKLRAALRRLEIALNNSGAKNARKWKSYLEWDALQQQLQRELPDNQELAKIKGSYQLLLDDWLQEKQLDDKAKVGRGLGQPPFVAVRAALVDFIWANNFVQWSGRDLNEPVETFVKQFEEALRDYSFRRDPTSEHAVGYWLNALERAGQAPEIVQLVRRVHSRPNFYTHVSKGLAGAGINDMLSDVSPVNDCLLGTTIRGTATTTGRYYLTTSAASGSVSLAIQVDANAAARSTAIRKKVRVYSTSNTSIFVRKPLQFYFDGRIYSQPALARCETRSQINGVSHRWGLVRKIARKKAYENQAFGERYASRKAERQAEEELDTRADPLLDEGRRDYDKYVTWPVQRLDFYPQLLHLSSSVRGLNGNGLVAGDSLLNFYGQVIDGSCQLGAWNAPPPMPANFDAYGQIHETMVANLADKFIRGTLMTRDKASTILKRLDQPPLEQDEDDWQMKFLDRKVVSVYFRQGTVRIAVRGENFKGGRILIESEDEAEISATYRVKPASNGVRLVRLGEVIARPLSRRGMATATRVLLESNIGKVFPQNEVIPLDKLPKPWDKAGKLRVAYIDARDGWLSIGVNAENVR